MKRVIIALSLLCSSAWCADYVNILVYHHVATNTPSSTSISPAKFREHLQLFKDEGFSVIGLDEAIDGITNNKLLPDNAMVITFDDGYSNIYENAWPLLKEFNYPFTIFVATEAIDQKFGGMLSWDQLREMHSGGVSIANHSTDHAYLARVSNRDTEWLNNTKLNIMNAQSRLETELGEPLPRWFAYPYGEFTKELKTLLADQGFVGFAQHSGGFWAGSDRYAIPRFAAAGIYANPATLLTKLKSHPMPVQETLLADMITDSPKPVLTATLIDTSDLSKALNCFVNGDWQEATWQNDQVFTLQTSNALDTGRHRYNCTAKSKSNSFYYWFSKPWLVFSDQPS